MRYRKLGSSELSVSEISLGSWLTYSGGVAREKSVACVERAFEVGINFFDTSNIYGRGAAETFLGEVLASRPRDSYVLATKLFFPMTEKDFGLSAAQIAKQLDDSLRRLKTDHVDLYQCHRYDDATPLEETMQALTRAIEQGKTRYIGFSEWSAEQIGAALKMVGDKGVAKFVSSQPQYSMLWRAPEAEVFPACHPNGIGQIVWSPLAEGLLTGKYEPGKPPPPDSRAASDRMGMFVREQAKNPVLLEAVMRLKPIAKDAGMTLPQLALAWVLRREELSSAIIGASRPEQVDENAAASGKTLSPDVLAAIDTALAGVSL
ncbi:MAG: aldo/keto reductase [Myxococcaceae bacterium]|nr:aldo/keto reductase [Myxococcaceae bacterium]